MVKKIKSKTVSIPKALWYHLYPGLWEVFFSRLGYHVILSDDTGRQTVERACLISEPEHCLPLKLHDAHLSQLIGQAECVFVPRILSTLPGHIACPKLGALPDCARAQFGDRVRVLSLEIDEKRSSLRRSLLKFGRELGKRRRCVRHAAEEAINCMKRRQQGVLRSSESGDRSGFFLLLAHPYNLHDRYISAPVVSKLNRLNVGWRFVDFSVRGVQPVLIRWDACSIMYDTLLNLDPQRCRGVIQLSSFNCGCDSVVMEIFRTLLRDRGIPYMVLVLDEHEAYAGVDTRLEAFVDSVSWRRKGNISPHTPH